MKVTNQIKDAGASFSRLRQRRCRGARLACEADLSGRHYGAWASSDRTSASSVEPLSSTAFNRSNGARECWSDGIEKPVFFGLVLELFARPVITNETVLPKAAVTAGKLILGLNLSVASAALRDARQRYLWKGEW